MNDNTPPLPVNPTDPSTPTGDVAKTKPSSKPKGFAQFGKTVGANALFGTSADLPRIIELDVDAIQTNPDQPRKTFDEDKISELADSIRNNGLIQPITVAKHAEGYVVVAGERRLRAHRVLERATIPAIVTTGEPDVIALIENVQREQLDPLEEADAYAQLIERHGYSQAELGRIVGKKQNTVSEALSLRRLSPALTEQYRTSDTRPSKNVLVEIAREPDADVQQQLMTTALDRRLGVRAVRDERRRLSPSATTNKIDAASARKDGLIRSLAVAVKRAQQDARAEDFPAGSDALERLRALKLDLDEALSGVFDQHRIDFNDKTK